jgi:hypothetical protein
MRERETERRTQQEERNPGLCCLMKVFNLSTDSGVGLITFYAHQL